MYPMPAVYLQQALSGPWEYNGEHADQGSAPRELRTVRMQIRLALSWKIPFCPWCPRKKEPGDSWAGQIYVRALPQGSRRQG